MDDDRALRDYCLRYLREARSIRAEASKVIREVEDLLEGDRADVLDPERLEEWLTNKRAILRHQQWELLLLAGAIGTPWWSRWLYRIFRAKRSPKKGSLQRKKRLP